MTAWCFPMLSQPTCRFDEQNMGLSAAKSGIQALETCAGCSFSNVFSITEIRGSTELPQVPGKTRLTRP